MRSSLRSWRRGLAASLTLLSLWSAASAADPNPATVFTKGPYLQLLTSSGVTVRWEGPDSLGGVVTVTGAGGFRERRDMSALHAAFHSVSVDGLKPATGYHYEVEAGSSKAEGDFVTAPDRVVPFDFIAYGDSRSDHAAHTRVISAMQKVRSDFLVNTGDMVGVGGDAEEWDTFFRIEGPLLRDRCMFSSIGNHEMVGGGTRAYLQYFRGTPQGGDPPLDVTMRWSNARFFFVDAMADWSGTSADHQWLARELERSEQEAGVSVRFVVLHVGPYSSGPHGGNPNLASGGVIELLQRHKVIVIAGHDHLYERGELSGLPYLITGGAGAPLYEIEEENMNRATEAAEKVHHFISIHVDGTQVTTRALRTDGSLIESCRIQPGGRWSCEGHPAILAHPPPPTTSAPLPHGSGSTGAPPSGGAPPPSKPGGCACELATSSRGATFTWWLALLGGLGVYSARAATGSRGPRGGLTGRLRNRLRRRSRSQRSSLALSPSTRRGMTDTER